MSIVSVPVRQLKDKLSAYLRRAAKGEELIVTSRRRPVARLLAVPPDLDEADGQSELKRVASLPWVRWEGGKPWGLEDPIHIRLQPGGIARLVKEDRR